MFKPYQVIKSKYKTIIFALSLSIILALDLQITNLQTLQKICAGRGIELAQGCIHTQNRA
jgi:hypothetical protein